MVPISQVFQRTSLVDDPKGRLLGPQLNPFDLIQPWVQHDRGFHRGLGMKLRRIGDLEQNILDHVAAQGTGKCDRLATEQDILEPPRWSAKRSGLPHLSCPRQQCQSHRTAGCIPRSPALARSGVRCVSVGA